MIKNAVVNLMRKGSVLLIGSNGLVLVARIASTVILTRLLDASAFGAVGILMTFAYITVMLTDVGFYPFVVRSGRTDDPDFLDRVWTVRLIRDAVLTLVFIALAKPMAWYVGVPGLEYALAVGSLTLILDGASSMAFAVAARNQRIGMLSLLDLIPALISIVVTIVAALFIRSYWALIIGILFSSVLKTTLSYYLFPGSRRKFIVDPDMFKQVWAFGRHIMPSSIIFLMIQQGDRFVLARVLDLSTFGLYSLASNLAAAPLNLMNAYTARILYPAFTKTHESDPASVSNSFYETGLYVRLLFMFIGGGAITSALIVIALLYDDRYLGAAQFLSIMLITAVTNFVIMTENELLIAIGRVKWQLRFNVLRLVIIVASAPFLYNAGGGIGLVWATAISAIFTKFAMSAMLMRLSLFRWRRELLLWSAVVGGMVVGYAGVVIVGSIWSNIPLPIGIRI